MLFIFPSLGFTAHPGFCSLSEELYSCSLSPRREHAGTHMRTPGAGESTRACFSCWSPPWLHSDTHLSLPNALKESG